jgi:predicted dehydrogenase
MMRGAIIGFGEVARHGHWPAYATSAELAIIAVVDRSEERRQLAESLSPVVRAYPSIDAVAGGPSLDFIDICTPPALHGAPMLMALEHRWHVLCEKPLLLDQTVVEMVRVRAANAGVAVVPVQNWKYAPIVAAATGALRAGAIGRLRHVEIETLRLRESATAAPGRPNWRRDPAIAGGGILMDHGWHAVYLTLHWFGEAPLDVRASVHRPSPSAVEDEASVDVTFASGDARISLTWNASTRRNTMRLDGDRGRIRIDDDVLSVNGARTPFARALSSGSHHEDWFAAMLPDVAAGFNDRASARRAFDEAAQCLGVIQRAYGSARNTLSTPPCKRRSDV